LVCIHYAFPHAHTYRLEGAFVAAPVGGLLFGIGAFALRLGIQWIRAKTKHERFDAFDRPTRPVAPSFYTGGEGSEDESHHVTHETVDVKGKFF
jgi:hypothetical protein